MKIMCNQIEFAALVRACEHEQTFEECRGCIFTPFCTKGELIVNDEPMMGIEDICEVVNDG